jgi:hypothetical protein
MVEEADGCTNRNQQHVQTVLSLVQEVSTSRFYTDTADFRCVYWFPLLPILYCIILDDLEMKILFLIDRFGTNITITSYLLQMILNVCMSYT